MVILLESKLYFRISSFKRIKEYIPVKQCSRCGSENNLCIHHKDMSFDNMLTISHDVFGLKYHKDSCDYTDDEKKKIKTYLIGLQMQGKYEVLCKTCHLMEHHNQCMKTSSSGRLKDNDINKIMSRNASHRNQTTLSQRVLLWIFNQPNGRVFKLIEMKRDIGMAKTEIPNLKKCSVQKYLKQMRMAKVGYYRINHSLFEGSEYFTYVDNSIA